MLNSYNVDTYFNHLCVLFEITKIVFDERLDQTRQAAAKQTNRAKARSSKKLFACVVWHRLLWCGASFLHGVVQGESGLWLPTTIGPQLAFPSRAHDLCEMAAILAWRPRAQGRNPFTDRSIASPLLSNGIFHFLLPEEIHHDAASPALKPYPWRWRASSGFLLRALTPP